MTTATTSPASPLATHVRLIRAAADLIEQAGIAGLVLYPEPDEIVIQVPQTSGDVPSRTRKVARLATLTGSQPAPSPQPGATRGWIEARGTFAGHPVHIFTPLSQEETTS
jgi:hypothetical protein